MKFFFYLLGAVFCMYKMAYGTDLSPSQPLMFPIGKKIPTLHKKHDDWRVDYYHWLSNKENPDTIAYLKNWNSYTDAKLAPLQPLAKTLYDETVSRMQKTDRSFPYHCGPYQYYYRLEEGKEHPIFCRESRVTRVEEILLDSNEAIKSYPFFRVITMEPSPNGKYIAFVVDTDGSQFGTIKIKEMRTGTFLSDEIIPNSCGKVVWDKESTGIWYVQVNETLRADKVRFHQLGTVVKDDLIVCEEKESAFRLSICKDKLNRSLFIVSWSSDTSEVKIANLNHPRAFLQVAHPREKGLKYFIIPGDRVHYLLVSKDRGNWGLMQVNVAEWGKSEWQEILPAHPDVDVVDLEVFKDYLALIKRSKGLLELEIWSRKDGKKHTVILPQNLCHISFLYNSRSHGFFETDLTYDGFDTPFVYFSFSSLVTPMCVYQYNMKTRTLKLLKQDDAGDFDPSLYVTERIWATAEDGTQIPISLCYKQGVPRDGSAPFYLYGYGAYGANIGFQFDPFLASLLDRGVYFGIAHVRGGGDLGRQWYQQGSLLKKKNSFTDFISCAEYLIKQKFTSKERLGICGGSAGGLLMGAVINMRPELFRVCVAVVPFVDILTTMLNEELPLTCEEWGEWGNPNVEADYNYIKSYSPIDNVTAQDYPALFVTAGLNDSRVCYHEPAKWVAKLVEYKTDSHLLLFKTNMEAGHKGNPGRYAQIGEKTSRMAFFLSQLGVRD